MFVELRGEVIVSYSRGLDIQPRLHHRTTVATKEVGGQHQLISKRRPITGNHVQAFNVTD
jgi:hypothetical protein